MKRTCRYIACFLLLYVIAMVINLPALAVFQMLPSAIRAQGVEGTFWAGRAQRLSWQGIKLRDLSWRWQWRHSMPAVRLAAQGDMGQGVVMLSWAGSWRFFDGRWQIAAQSAIGRAAPLLPLESEGDLILSLSQLRLGNGCQHLAATLTWRNAALAAGGQRVAAGEPQVVFTCQAQRLIFTLHQRREAPRVAGEGSVDTAGNYRFSGQLAPTQDLPPQWRKFIESATRAGDNGQRTVEISGRW